MSDKDKNRAVRKLFEKQEYTVYLEEVPESPKTSSSVIFFGDGEFLLRKNGIGTFFDKIEEKDIPSLEDGPEPFFEFNLPKIDPSILRTQVAFYREVMKEHQNSEAYTLILWDKESHEYILVCPKQEVSGARVEYDLDLSEYPSSRYIQVVSCHSHNTMGAFFSGTDDADEQADMLYMVLGKLNNDTPEYKIRANMKGQEICTLPLDEIFELTDQEFTDLSKFWKGDSLFPKEWLSKVVKLSLPMHSVTKSAFGRSRFRHNLGSFNFRRAPGRQESFSFYSYNDNSYLWPEEQIAQATSVGGLLSSCLRYSQSADPQEVALEIALGLVRLGYNSELEDALEDYAFRMEKQAPPFDPNRESDSSEFLKEFEAVNSYVQNETLNLNRLSSSGLIDDLDEIQDDYVFDNNVDLRRKKNES